MLQRGADQGSGPRALRRHGVDARIRLGIFATDRLARLHDGAGKIALEREVYAHKMPGAFRGGVIEEALAVDELDGGGAGADDLACLLDEQVRDPSDVQLLVGELRLQRDDFREAHAVLPHVLLAALPLHELADLAAYASHAFEQLGIGLMNLAAEEFHDADCLRANLDREGERAVQVGVRRFGRAAKARLLRDVANPCGLAFRPGAPDQAAGLSQGRRSLLRGLEERIDAGRCDAPGLGAAHHLAALIVLEARAAGPSKGLADHADDLRHRLGDAVRLPQQARDGVLDREAQIHSHAPGDILRGAAIPAEGALPVENRPAGNADVVRLAARAEAAQHQIQERLARLEDRPMLVPGLIQNLGAG